MRNIHYWLTWMFARQVIPAHNLSIMSLPRFRSLFSGIDPLFCGYSGGIDLMMADYQNQPWVKSAMLAVLRRFDFLLKVAGNLLPLTFDTPWSSHLMFIGRKS